MHDYDPGIFPYPNGLFWTIAVPDDAVEADLEDAEASLRLSDVPTRDYFNIPNALFRTKGSDPAVFSLDIRWSGVKKRGTVTNSKDRYEFDFAQTGAHISWSGKNLHTGATFHTTDGAQKVGFAQIARERNGVFFDSDEGD